MKLADFDLGSFPRPSFFPPFLAGVLRRLMHTRAAGEAVGASQFCKHILIRQTSVSLWQNLQNFLQNGSDFPICCQCPARTQVMGASPFFFSIHQNNILLQFWTVGVLLWTLVYLWSFWTQTGHLKRPFFLYFNLKKKIQMIPVLVGNEFWVPRRCLHFKDKHIDHMTNWSTG